MNCPRRNGSPSSRSFATWNFMKAIGRLICRRATSATRWRLGSGSIAELGDLVRFRSEAWRPGQLPKGVFKLKVSAIREGSSLPSGVSSRLMASITSTLPFGATFTFLPCRSSKSMSLSSTCPIAAVPPICVMIFKPTESRAKGAFVSLTASPRNERLPENGISVRSNRREFSRSQIPCCVGACHAPKEFQKGGTRASRDANLPICGQSHSAGHKSAGLAVSDLEKFVDDFAFLVVINPGFRSLIELRQGPEPCRIHTGNLGAKDGHFRCELRVGNLLGSSEVIEKSLTDLVFACLRI